MASSRSRFYVETPLSNEPPSQRHSMYVSHSELGSNIQKQDVSSASSSATLPSAAGSVDRLTGLGNEKKTPRFFTLKPKTSFSLRAFISSSSIASLSPSKRRKSGRPEAALRRDSYVQTDDNERMFDEVGVQTLNASTVDVPVQTCSTEWEEGDTYRRSLTTEPTFPRFPHNNYPSRWSSSAASRPPGFISNYSKGSKNSFVAPLDSSKLLKYAAPHDSADSSSKAASTGILQGVTSSDTVPRVECLLSSTAEPVKSHPVRNIATTSECTENPLLKTSEAKETVLISSSLPTNNFLINRPKSNYSSPKYSGIIPQSENSNKKINEITKSSSDGKINLFRSSDSPTSVLKIERSDSPKCLSKNKSVHFKLSDSEPETATSKINSDISEPRNIDKEFEALLRNLDILTDEQSEPIIPISSTSTEVLPKVNPISPDLKLALDFLKQDFLAPIPENDLNDENPERNTFESFTNTSEVTPSTNEKLDEKDLKINITSSATNDEPKSAFSPTFAEVENRNNISGINKEGCGSTSSATFTTSKLDLNVETSGNSENVYDKENTVEPVKTVFLPTLPSFFESSSECRNLASNDIVDSNLEIPIDTSALEGSKEDTMLSRSSSRSSLRSNPRSDFDAYLERASKFDSCENLDQLEEEIIRSLYSPNEDECWETNSIVQQSTTPVQHIDGAGTSNATVVRRAILDRLLSGESVDEIMPSSPITAAMDLQFVDPIDIRKKVKRGKKYTATISKYEEPQLENFSNSNLQHITNDNFEIKSLPEHFPAEVMLDKTGKSSIMLYPVKDKLESPKETSVFLFPDTNPQNPGLTSNNSMSVSNEVINTDIMDNSIASTNILAISQTKEEPNNHQNITKCDFTNCLRPSELRSSPFLAEISSKSSNFCSSPDLYTSRFPIPSSQINNDDPKPVEIKPQKQNGQCDFESCLKPSQVQNSSFTVELSELTANKSSSPLHDSLRNNSPLNFRSFTPPALKKDNREEKTEIKTEKKDPVSELSESDRQHRSELTIILQMPSQDQSPIEKKDEEINETEKQAQSPVMVNKGKLLEYQNNEEQSGKQATDSSSISSAIPPPPPPPISKSKNNLPSWKTIENSSSLADQIQDQQSNLVKTAIQSIESKSSQKSPVVLELEKHLKKRSQIVPEEQNSESCLKDEVNLKLSDLDITMDERSYNNRENCENYSPVHKIENNFGTKQNFGYQSFLNDKTDRHHNQNGVTYSPNAVITSEPPPPGAVLVDKKITVEGDKVHTDKYYALPVKEILKETTSTTRFVPAPPKYEGIGPTEDGIPIGLRNSVKKENMHNWYKTMYKSLHKADSSNDPQEYIVGYSSEPESSKKDKIYRKKSATLDNRSSSNNVSRTYNNFGKGYPPSAKSSIETYHVRPRLIEDYEPGQSSVTDDEITIGYKRFLPPMNVPKPSYEFKNGYEQDNHFTKKLEQPDPPTLNQQKTWYKEVQLGGEVPKYGLGKSAPEKLKEPTVGPLPPPPLNYNGPISPHQATRPLALPTNYSPRENGICQQMNGSYEFQMRQAIHTELHQRLSPSSSSQLSSPTRSILKSPSKSPDLKIPARALFDFKAESPKEIPLKKGDNVLILRQLDKNWYEGEKQGIIGIFPINYIEIIPPEHASISHSHGVGRVLYDFTAHTLVELTVKKHDSVSLLRRVDSNWYEAQFQNKKGIIPASYLQVLQEPTEKKTPLSSPNSYMSSHGSRPTSREGILKVSSPIPYSPQTLNPPVMTNERSKLQNRCKKNSNLVEPIMYRALYSYTPQNTDELELAEGDNIYVVEMCDDGWYVGTSVRTGVFGIFPGNYVEKV